MKVIVIGAGPSGLICSYKLKQRGFDVLLIDKNEKVGKKIYITGKGRCNVTNNCTREDFFENVVTNPKFLFSAYANFNSQDTMAFFENNGVSLITERGNRVFPKSYRAGDIAQALFDACKNAGVQINLNEEVLDIIFQQNSFKIVTKKGNYSCDKIVIATGGKSYSYTGSSGDGYRFAKKLGHSIVDLKPSLVALRIRESVPSSLYKFTLKNVTLKARIGNKKLEEFGEVTFYKEGIAGATALTLSSTLNKYSPGDVELSLDFKPALTEEKLDQRILREIQDKVNQNLENVVHKLLPKEMVNWFFGLSKIDKNIKTNEVTKETRESLVKNLKSFRFNYEGLDDIDRAVVTSGGINTKEINPKTLESKIVPGLYFAGEVIDVDAYTGGFNMQIAFSTGALVADSIKNY